jgi:hypothetical protein
MYIYKCIYIYIYICIYAKNLNTQPLENYADVPQIIFYSVSTYYFHLYISYIYMHIYIYIYIYMPKNPATQPLENCAKVPQIIFYTFSDILSVVLFSYSIRISQLLHFFYSKIYLIIISGNFSNFIIFVIVKSD